jgi:hypothetical protein
MKKKMTLALASSMLVFTLAAAPHRALAASDSFLYIDGSGDGGGSHTTPPPQHGTIVTFIMTVFGL